MAQTKVTSPGIADDAVTVGKIPNTSITNAKLANSSITIDGVTSFSNRSVGPFIYTGFKPSYVVIKQATGTGTNGWYILDTKRAGYNHDNENLLINTNAAEDATNNFLDLYSNGFKIKTTGGIMNGSGSTYIYCAFGQALVGGNGVVGTAR